ncbi:MAG: 2-oxoacid:acceptor oxidoreductase family protein [Caldisericia bacterium]|nr:2-oxoacid:acceptor oxidoreductase family protein [Caldisericia bacterium]MDD4614074.1 2-oxoacid:acceptor oxidoreductase family protein [Caldisericia bacterium]
MRKEIRYSGSGGQGLITATRVIARAALRENKNALQSQSYGAEARGGATKSEVIISDKEIFFPEVEIPDILLLMTQEAYTKYGTSIKENGIRILDSFFIPDYEPISKAVTHTEPFTAICEEEFGTRIVANMMATGYMLGITKVIEISTFTQAIGDFFSDNKLTLNIKAAKFGYEMTKKGKEEETDQD